MVDGGAAFPPKEADRETSPRVGADTRWPRLEYADIASWNHTALSQRVPGGMYAAATLLV
jgi:hypothetical protein